MGSNAPMGDQEGEGFESRVSGQVQEEEVCLVAKSWSSCQVFDGLKMLARRARALGNCTRGGQEKGGCIEQAKELCISGEPRYCFVATMYAQFGSYMNGSSF